ncbi:hypothetical protein SOVF_149470 [Spinacia oleracea]|uniref:Uncharacterized protein LOC110777786 n=1 Tax=Spinacia oleracea TaxID=3562 RepID=A0A9R0HVZ6_SPIOL|nr:uncharacterized protein LOC110777786 [Spinacia oleracea]XP_021838063.1 uncharacterized protein LOC110777786 [Spinacia oleracea]KNA09883.1 hypothetical protein SOVF_149470 [Spinacia oleracea]
MASLRFFQALSKGNIGARDAVFRNMPYDSASILAEASKAVIQYKDSDVQPTDVRVANIGRNACGEADVVLQIAGSWQKRSLTGGAAWIMKDECLQKIHGSCLQTFGVSALEMDALACLHGVKWAASQRLHNVSIYT